MQKCNFCGEKFNENLTLKSAKFDIFNGMAMCNECLNDYSNLDFDKLIKKLEKWSKKLTRELNRLYKKTEYKPEGEE